MRKAGGRDFFTEREVYRKILGIAGINTELISDERKYSSKTLSETFVPWAISNYLVLKGIFPRLATPKQIENDPVRVFGSMLRHLGLCHLRVGTTKDGEYMIDVEGLKRKKELLVRRGKIPKSQTDNVNNINIQQSKNKKVEAKANEFVVIKKLLDKAETPEEFMEIGKVVIPEFIIETHIKWLELDDGEKVDYEAIPKIPKEWPYTMRQVVDRYHDFLFYTADKFSDDNGSNSNKVLTNLVKAIDILAWKIWRARLDAEEEEY